MVISEVKREEKTGVETEVNREDRGSEVNLDFLIEF